jgi:hypothetical protein
MAKYRITAMKAAPEGGRLIKDEEFNGRRLGIRFDGGEAHVDQLDAVALFHLKRWGSYHLDRYDGHAYRRVDFDEEMKAIQTDQPVDPAALSDVSAAGQAAAAEVAPVNVEGTGEPVLVDTPAPEGTPTTPDPVGEAVPTKDGKPRGR